MRTHTITRTVAGGILLLLVGGGVACSKSAAAFKSPYCNNIRQFSAYDMKSGNDESAAAHKANWQAYVTFMDTGLRTAPASIRKDWVLYHAAVVAPETAILEKYGYDRARFEQGATDAEKAAMNVEETNAKVGTAVKNVKTYEAFKCGTGQPPDAKVSFKGEKPGAYCDAVKQDNENNQSIDFGDPESVRAALTDPAKNKAAAATDALFISTAPKVIKDDVKAEVTWWNTKQKPVQARYGYDMAKLFLHGSAQDLADLNLTDKRIANHYARATAYEHQVCGT